MVALHVSHVWNTWKRLTLNQTNGIDMINGSLTPEERKALGRIFRKYLLKNGLTGVKYGFFFFFTLLATALLDVYYVQSQDFLVLVSIINGIFLIHFLLKELIPRNLAMQQEIREIIQPKEKK
jgi:glucose uptake protein GlcU